ncbi:hypothetical protein BJY01DRAFT_224159 [Aspergillus pseudoustus]|uniref:Uncharacterized protein n=1 Tax=Aspergillus pseudoustus TaxID=1810923 RepID=A0ABR4J3Q2_9EURO
MSVAFAQQGTVDWTSLGRMQFSASIAVLSRLSSTGIESLTIAFGQAMCTWIPLGAHGEKFLMESLNKLKAFSSFGDLVWFGVGVRHVLRDIVQTAEGASLIALCAALSETYPTNCAALILYEMAKEVKAPSELSPSLAQWEALVKTSSCAFKETTFSVRIEKLLKLAGFSSSSLSIDLSGSKSSPGHPQDIARSIIALGEIMRGAVEQITIHGGRATCWLATYASLILGLRVQFALNGELLFINYDERKASAQLCIEVLATDTMENTLYHVGTVLTVRNGREFLSQVFGGTGDAISGLDAKSFLGGTVPWDTLIVDTFGSNGEKLLNQLGFYSSTPDQSDSVSLDDAPFRVLYHIAIGLFTITQRGTYDHEALSQYVAIVGEKLPELGRFKLASLPKDLFSGEWFMNQSEYIKQMCKCSRCTRKSGGDDPSTSCLLITAYTIIFLGYLMERCHIHSTDLRPRRFGIHSIYMRLKYRDDGPSKERFTIWPDYGFRSLFALGDIQELYGSYAAIFSGKHSWHRSTSTHAPGSFADASAYSADGVYCFLDSLAGLSMDFTSSSRVHIGCGAIEFRSRLHNWVFDRSKSIAGPTDSDYPAEEMSRTDDLSALQADLSSSFLTLEAVIEDTFNLVFYYRVSSPRGQRLISPAKFAVCTLGQMPDIMAGPELKAQRKSPAVNALRDITYRVVRGEGKVPPSETGLMLRPHKGNLLAQCVAASWCPGSTAFARSDEELSRILAWYATRLEKWNKKCNGGENPSRLFIISG